MLRHREPDQVFEWGCSVLRSRAGMHSQDLENLRLRRLVCLQRCAPCAQATVEAAAARRELRASKLTRNHVAGHQLIAPPVPLRVRVTVPRPDRPTCKRIRVRKALLPACLFSSSWCLSRACLGKAASTFATCNLSHRTLFSFRRPEGFTIGACPIEGIAPKTKCGGESNVNSFGDICTGGLYTYDVPSGTWKDNFLTNKDVQAKEVSQFDIDRGDKFIPSARNDAVQWSERPMGAKNESTPFCFVLDVVLVENRSFAETGSRHV